MLIFLVEVRYLCHDDVENHLDYDYASVLSKSKRTLSKCDVPHTLSHFDVFSKRKLISGCAVGPDTSERGKLHLWFSVAETCICKQAGWTAAPLFSPQGIAVSWRWRLVLVKKPGRTTKQRRVWFPDASV